MNRKKIAVILFSVVFCGILMWQMDSNKAYADTVATVVVSDGGLNMRAGIGTIHEKIASIPNGTQVVILDAAAGTDTNGTSWYRIRYNNLEGYVSSLYISMGAAAPTPTPAATPAATPVPTQAPQITPVTVYRTSTSYKKIKVSAKMKKTRAISRNTAGKNLQVKGQNVVLKKNKSVKIIAEKTKGKNKWFKVQFTYKKKTRKGYIKSTDVRMELTQKPATGMVTGVKTALRVRKQPGNTKPYYKVNGRQMVLAKKQYVTILKTRTVKKKIWYRISYEYYGRTYKGYVQAKYIKLAKTKVQKKVPVTVLSEKQFEEEMTRQGFPDSYKDSLRKLHAAYPYWQFTAFKTGMDWNAAIDGEYKPGTGSNLISNGKSQAWKSMDAKDYDATSGKWKVYDGSTWVAASREAIMYYMDVRNFLSIQGIYQFEVLEYQSQYQTIDGVNNILANTPFAGTTFTYTDDLTGTAKEISYAAAFMEAARESGVSPYHLASRSKQEVVTGATTTSIAVAGNSESFPGIFNFYNIGAYSGTSPALKGLEWASTGTTFLRPWNNRYRSIVGGGMYIGSNYINQGQNTGYLQKFNVTATKTFSHQYMTNVEAANSEALKTKNAYNGILDSVPLVFSIPVYENMPAENCAAPQ